MEVGLLCSVRLWFFAKPCRVRRRENLCHGLSGDDSKPVQASKGGVSLELLSWGGGYQGQLGVPPSKLKGDKGEASKKTINRGVKITFPDDEEPRHVACGGSFSAVVTSSGKVYTWGMGKEGQLGYKTVLIEGLQHEPMQVTGELSAVSVMAIACGREHTLVLSFQGDMYSWGSNKYGQLGQNHYHNEMEPRRVEVESNLSFKRIATGDQHSAAISSDGKVYTWGNGEYGNLGHGDPPKRANKTDLYQPVPKLVEPLKEVPCKLVSCGATQTSIITVPGRVYVCGSVEKYAAGPGVKKPITTDQFLYTPVELDLHAKAGPVQQVACGKSHLLLLTDAGDVYTVGAGSQNQLGHGRKTDLGTPRLVLQGKKVFHVAAGRYHSVAITAHGSMYTWGCGDHGQLCHGVDAGERIPRVVDSLLNRALLKTACGEHHTISLCTAAMEDSLSPDMVVWRFLEHEEYEMKLAIADTAGQSMGVTRKHLQQVQNMVREVIGSYEERLAAAAPAEAGAAAIGPAPSTGDDAPPFQAVTDRISALVNSSKQAFDVWQSFAEEIREPEKEDRPKPAPKPDLKLPPIKTPREQKAVRGEAGGRGGSAGGGGGGGSSARLKPHPPASKGGPGEHIDRMQMYLKLEGLQESVRKSVADVVKDDPSRGIEKMERELITLRDVYSGMEAQRRLRAEETEQLRTEFRGLDGKTEADDVRALQERADALKVQLQAVRLRWEEAKENREVFDLVIQSLKGELTEQSHKIAELHTFQRDHDLLLERMVARKDAALEQMVETQKEGRRVELESRQLRESLNEHLGGVRKLVQYMERTVSYVTKAAEDREAKENEKQKKKIAKLQQKLEQTKERLSQIRTSTAGAAFTLGTWLEMKFATITEQTGFGIADVDTIVDKIATRDEVMAEMHASREEKKRMLKELATQKKKVEQDLVDIRTQYFNERTLHLVDKTRSDLEKAQSKAGAPMVKWKEATITLARFHQLALTLIQKVDYVKHAGQEPPSSAELDRVRNLDDICLWKPTDNVEKNT